MVGRQPMERPSQIVSLCEQALLVAISFSFILYKYIRITIRSETQFLHKQIQLVWRNRMVIVRHRECVVCTQHISGGVKIVRHAMINIAQVFRLIHLLLIIVILLLFSLMTALFAGVFSTFDQLLPGICSSAAARDNKSKSLMKIDYHFIYWWLEIDRNAICKLIRILCVKNLNPFIVSFVSMGVIHLVEWRRCDHFIRLNLIVLNWCMI